MGEVIGAALGAALGWAAGHVALLVPSGGTEPRSPAKTEHVLGVLLGAGGLALAWSTRSSLADAAVTAVFALILIPILIIDLLHHDVYPLMPLTGFIAGLALNPFAGEASFLGSLIGGLLGAVAFLVLFLVGLLLFRTDALGSGDIMLAGMIGAMAGFALTPLALLLGTILSGLGGGLLLVFRRKGMGDYVPFGSGMCLAAIIVLMLRGE